MKVVLSTRNPSKVEQIKVLFFGSAIEFLSLDHIGLLSGGIENGTTLEENALKKADYAYYYGGYWSMADDTGIFIDALNGKPGVHTADWLGGKQDAQVKVQLILKKLENVTNRAATFRTVVALVNGLDEKNKHLFKGEVRGILLREPRCIPQPQMPYSAIFQPDGSEKVWAEMTVEQENQISHRGKAFRQARDFLEILL